MTAPGPSPHLQPSKPRENLEAWHQACSLSTHPQRKGLMPPFIKGCWEVTTGTLTPCHLEQHSKIIFKFYVMKCFLQKLSYASVQSINPELDCYSWRSAEGWPEAPRAPRAPLDRSLFLEKKPSREFPTPLNSQQASTSTYFRIFFRS